MFSKPHLITYTVIQYEDTSQPRTSKREDLSRQYEDTTQNATMAKPQLAKIMASYVAVQASVEADSLGVCQEGAEELLHGRSE